ncbi:MAG TPA: thioredoxin family protein [Rhizomicrobium sp.]|jgi:thiol-disulfide isomerase/thioredoxin|nr:thioredoxin family protein [Rhizomicrobium sp.]
MMMRFVVAGVVAFALAVPAFAATAPKVALASITDLPVVIREPYDVNADANKDVAAAFARARKSGKRVLIDLGGNWCGDCVVLANIMQLPEVKPFVAAHYEVVSVDIGRENKNLQIPANFGVDLSGGVPALLIVEPDGKTLVDAGHISALEDARHMTPQGLADWLAQWAK